MPAQGVERYPSAVRRLTGLAVARLERRLREGTPSLSGPTVSWMRALAGGRRAEDYFLHPAAFPIVLLPWWMEASVCGSASRAFQADVIYSTICGYYAVRMIDDIMDRDAEPDPRVLPALLLLDAEAERVYHGHFELGHAFWDLLRNATDTGAEAASRDVSLEAITRSDFIETCARKTAGATVPLAAVACRYDRAEAFGAWSGLVDRFGRWHQMLNDMHDWARDLARGRTSYFLSEAARRSPAAPGEWVLREGLAWGQAQLTGWMAEALESAMTLRSPPLVAYLECRRRDVDREWRQFDATLSTLERRLLARGPSRDPRPE